jgi:hypothetical protein
MSRIYRSPVDLIPLPPPDTSLFTVLEGTDPENDPRFLSGRPLFVDVPTGASYTFKQFFERVELLGRGILNLQIVGGELGGRIGVWSKNTLDYPTVVVGAIRIGVP